MPYTILIQDKKSGYPKARCKITDEGAKLIWEAYVKMWGNSQSMERREERGGIAYDTEISRFIEAGHLPKDFDWQQYLLVLHE